MTSTTVGFRASFLRRRWKTSISVPLAKYSRRSEPDDEDDKSNKWKNGWIERRNESLKGVGQVIFLNSDTSGAFILASLAVGDPYLASLATLGTVTSTMAAHSFKLDRSLLQNGLWAYNGCLMGCISATFVAPHSFFMGAVSTLVGASAATAVTAVLPPILPPRMPQWTYAFNVAALIQLVRIQPLLEAKAASDAAQITLSSILFTPLVGLSQIFVVENVFTGLGIAMAVANYSPLLAVHALAGSTVGASMGLLLGAPLTEVTSGLWGFNAALTSMGVGVFFHNTRPTWVLSVTGAAATSLVFGSLKVFFFNVAASPCLTLPFCITMSGCWLLAAGSKPVVPFLSLAANPHSPEHNKEEN